nr:hypothetical protein Iba_chr04aCG18080 [Ipomoea batatas]
MLRPDAAAVYYCRYLRSTEKGVPLIFSAAALRKGGGNGEERTVVVARCLRRLEYCQACRRPPLSRIMHRRGGSPEEGRSLTPRYWSASPTRLPPSTGEGPPLPPSARLGEGKLTLCSVAAGRRSRCLYIGMSPEVPAMLRPDAAAVYYCRYLRSTEKGAPLIFSAAALRKGGNGEERTVVVARCLRRLEYCQACRRPPLSRIMHRRGGSPEEGRSLTPRYWSASPPRLPPSTGEGPPLPPSARLGEGKLTLCSVAATTQKVVVARVFSQCFLILLFSSLDLPQHLYDEGVLPMLPHSSLLLA